MPIKEKIIRTYQRGWFSLVLFFQSCSVEMVAFILLTLAFFYFLEVSESRKKVDVQMIQSLNPQHMQNHGERVGHRETDASQSESEFNLRKSLAWDSAFFTSPGLLPRLNKPS